MMLWLAWLTVAAPANSVDAHRDFWSFRHPQRHALPRLSKDDGSKEYGSPRRIDVFVRARLEEAGLKPSPRADRRVLARRLAFDLTGLPPSPELVEAFASDESPDAYERLVTRLLSSPAYGERWARLWLDVARYAEDQAHIVGNNKALFYPNAYLYRDWLVGALNDDIAFDRFILLQLAGDHLPDAKDQDAQRAALGFLGLGPKYYNRNPHTREIVRMFRHA
ncbi:MAG: DUF1549 domain-containing protein [Planctomycetota bacterium]